MVTREAGLRILVWMGRVGMAVAILMMLWWLMFAHLAFGLWSVRIVKIETIMVAAFVISLCLTRVAPWVGFLVGWVDVALILSRMVPWNPPGSTSPWRQFMADLVFLASVNLVFFASSLLRRRHVKALMPL